MRASFGRRTGATERAAAALRLLRNERNLDARSLSLAAGLPEYFISRVERNIKALGFAEAVAITGAMDITLQHLADKMEEML